MKCVLEAPNDKRATIMQAISNNHTMQVQIIASSTDQMKCVVMEAPNNKRASIMQVISNNHKEGRQFFDHSANKNLSYVTDLEKQTSG